MLQVRGRFLARRSFVLLMVFALLAGMVAFQSTPTLAAPIGKISGYVRQGSSSGPGVANVKIYFGIASYPVTQRATTNAYGYYEFTYDTQGHQETLQVRTSPVSAPSVWYGITYGYGESRQANFVIASSITPTPTKTPTRTPTPIATATKTATPTATKFPCPTLTPEPLWVDPVTSPTFQLTQTVKIYTSNAQTLTVQSEAGNVIYTGPTPWPTGMTINLLPNTVHHLTVFSSVRRTVDSNGCVRGGYTLQVTRDRAGNPLTIIQGNPTPTSGSPTATPTPAISPWDPNGRSYAVGDKVTYGGRVYACRQAHASQPAWSPNVTPALWQ